MVIGRTMWDHKVPILKGTEVSLSCVQCFLYLLSSSVNVSIFHITWLDTFWIPSGQTIYEWHSVTTPCKSNGTEWTSTICNWYIFKHKCRLQWVVRNSGSGALVLQLESWLCNMQSNLNNLLKPSMPQFLIYLSS